MIKLINRYLHILKSVTFFFFFCNSIVLRVANLGGFPPKFKFFYFHDFDFIRFTIHQPIIKSILEILPRYCPNIETIDFRYVSINCENRENFKNLLKNIKHLKSLRVKCRAFNYCAINQILLQEDFDLHDRDLQIELQKIEYINGMNMSPSQCIKLFKLLPNLKSFGMSQSLGPIVSSCIDNDNDLNRFMTMTEFADQYTNSTTLDLFVKYCPNAKRIFLYLQEKKCY